MQVLLVGVWNPITWAIRCCLPGCAKAGSWDLEAEQGLKPPLSDVGYRCPNPYFKCPARCFPVNAYLKKLKS